MLAAISMHTITTCMLAVAAATKLVFFLFRPCPFCISIYTSLLRVLSFHLNVRGKVCDAEGQRLRWGRCGRVCPSRNELGCYSEKIGKTYVQNLHFRAFWLRKNFFHLSVFASNALLCDAPTWPHVSYILATADDAPAINVSHDEDEFLWLMLHVLQRPIVIIVAVAKTVVGTVARKAFTIHRFK